MVYDCPEPDNSPRGDPSRELATIHTICETHKAEILDLSFERVSDFFIVSTNANKRNF